MATLTPGDNKLKLDLHTHCFEAINYNRPTPEYAQIIIDQVKARGLDGIAVTEHSDSVYGKRFKEMVDAEFHNQILVIPGRERRVGIYHGAWENVVELFLPGDAVFRFWAHPIHWYERLEADLGVIHGVEVDNALHDWHIDKERVRAFAQERALLLLSNSDAHQVKDIGLVYNEVALEELIARAKGEWPP